MGSSHSADTQYKAGIAQLSLQPGFAMQTYHFITLVRGRYLRAKGVFPIHRKSLALSTYTRVLFVCTHADHVGGTF